MSTPVVAHICDGGPKTWHFGWRYRMERKYRTRPAPNQEVARQQLLRRMVRDPKIVEGVVLFSQEWYDPHATLRIRVGR